MRKDPEPQAGSSMRMSARTAARPRFLPFEELAHRILHDVIHDIRWRVVDAARLLDLRLFLYPGPMPRCEVDDLAQELLIYLAEDISGKDGKFIGTFGIVKALEDFL